MRDGAGLVVDRIRSSDFRLRAKQVATRNKVSNEKSLASDDLPWSSLLRENGIVVSRESIVVDGCRYPLTQRTKIEAEQRGPRVLAALLCFVLGTIGIPAAVLINRVTPDDYSWLVGFPVAFVLGTVFRFLTVEPTYAVVLRTAGKARPILESEDRQMIIRVVAALRDGKAVLDVAERGYHARRAG
jgi:hypothetical protein